jgi:hypothetical protein
VHIHTEVAMPVLHSFSHNLLGITCLNMNYKQTPIHKLFSVQGSYTLTGCGSAPTAPSRGPHAGTKHLRVSVILVGILTYMSHVSRDSNIMPFDCL